MNKAILTVVTTSIAAASLCMSSVTFAQAGGAGQGGDAHGAATAGMTYHGDPISSPWTTKPAGWNGDQTSSTNPPPPAAMSSDDGSHKQPDAQ
ncbi:MAG: hypothetical protein WCA85_17725 [Paraburkholderia sp.]|uniref:hypothetical protein n=1 Tax=Paraburkholderia sp. TaxID=1926495 RepID=UPI003C4002E9